LLAVTLVMAEASSWGRRPLFRWPTLLVCRTTLALGLLFTFSRSAWIGLALSLLLLSLLKPAAVARLAATALAGIPVVLIIMGSRFVPIVQEMSRRPEQVQERFDLINQAIDSFQHHPFIGGGLGSFRLAAGEIAHNSAMWFLADFGIAGLAVLLGFLTWFFVRGWTAYQLAGEEERPLALAVLLAHVSMTGLAMGIEAFYQRHWWLVLALIASAHSLVMRSRKRANQSAVPEGDFA
jgi:O-antigen ligase